MKKVLLLLLLVLPIFIFIGLYFLDKSTFLSPIEYRGDIVIRNDNRGDGFFAAERKGNRIHEGIDLFAEVGQPVMAARSGIVIAATKSKGMGKYVIIRHCGNLTSVYGHLSQIYVHHYQLLRQGDVIGSVGKTGNANVPGMQPHLHFEVRKNGAPQDPAEYLQ